jgi:hypothetical protein
MLLTAKPASPENVIKLMKTKLNRKSLFGHSGHLLALLIVTLFALSFPVASPVHAQSGGPGRDAGVVTSIDDNTLEIRDGSHTTSYVETEQTQWLNKRGQRIEAGDVVGKMVEVRFRWITGGSEALSVRISSNGSGSAGSSSSVAAPRSRSGEGSSFNGTWRNNQKAETLTITVTGESALLDYSPGTPDQGTVRGNYIYYQGLRRSPVGSEVRLLKENGSIRLSADGMHLSLAHDITYPDHIKSEIVTYTRVR